MMIKVRITNNMLNRISVIDKNKFSLSTIKIPAITANKLRKNSKKKSSYASLILEIPVRYITHLSNPSPNPE